MSCHAEKSSSQDTVLAHAFFSLLIHTSVPTLCPPFQGQTPVCLPGCLRADASRKGVKYKPWGDGGMTGQKPVGIRWGTARVFLAPFVLTVRAASFLQDGSWAVLNNKLRRESWVSSGQRNPKGHREACSAQTEPRETEHSEPQAPSLLGKTVGTLEEGGLG